VGWLYSREKKAPKTPRVFLKGVTPPPLKWLGNFLGFKGFYPVFQKRGSGPFFIKKGPFSIPKDFWKKKVGKNHFFAPPFPQPETQKGLIPQKFFRRGFLSR